MIYFISDLHLDPSREDITQGFYRFLDKTQAQAESLYILGDLFEAWLGDDDDTPMYREVIARLADYSKTCSLFVMHGNRDFLIGNGFTQQTGATLLDDPTVITLGDTEFLISHGDVFCTDDKEYMAFRQTVRQDEWKANILSKSLDERKAFAAHVRASSKESNRQKAQDIMDVSKAAVLEMMAQHNVYRLIHGHTHRPFDHQFTHNGHHCQRLVLGDWDSHGWHAQYDGQTLSLHQWPLLEP